jgi:hypothetical protein
MDVFLQTLGEHDREIDTFAQLAGRFRAWVGGVAQFLESIQQPLKIVRHQMLAEHRVTTGARKVLFGD